MNTKAIRQLADVTLDKYRSSIPRKAFEQVIEEIVAAGSEGAGLKYEATLLCRGSFPATLEENGEPCIVEASVYRLNAVATASFMLDGPEGLLLHLGLSETDTYITKHDIDDLVTVVRILRKEADTWQH